MAERTPIIPEGMQAVYDDIHYAPGVKVGNVVYVSGQIGRDANMKLVEDKRAQFIQVFENLKLVLEAAGASFDDVVDVLSFHTDMRDLPLYSEIRDQYLTNSDNYPTWTAIGAAMLGGQAGYYLEVKVVAHLPE